jgi:hypothetical protein
MGISHPSLLASEQSGREAIGSAMLASFALPEELYRHPPASFNPQEWLKIVVFRNGGNWFLGIPSLGYRFFILPKTSRRELFFLPPIEQVVWHLSWSLSRMGCFFCRRLSVAGSGLPKSTFGKSQPNPPGNTRMSWGGDSTLGFPYRAGTTFLVLEDCRLSANDYNFHSEMV